MDSLTHIALGACIGELFADKPFKRKAMLWGAAAQSLPDIDFIAALWLTPTEDLIAHRGITHSILFAISASILLALLAERWHRTHGLGKRKWMLFIATEIFVHLFIDSFNNYGTGWFEPFSDVRISFHTLFVVDPIFSLPAIIACISLFLFPTDHRHRLNWARAAITFSIVYLAFGLYNKIRVSEDVRRLAQKQGIHYDRYFTTPTPFNTWLWFVVMERKDGYLVGYHSFFDRDDSLLVNPFPKNEQLLNKISDHHEVDNLKLFSQGYYTIEQKGDTVVFNDLRFGQEIGWYDARQPFAFHYYLTHPEDNQLVVQRGRFAKWNKKTTRMFIHKIAGY